MRTRGRVVRLGGLVVALLLLAAACVEKEEAGTEGRPAAAPSPIDGLYLGRPAVLKIEAGKWELVSYPNLRLAGDIAVSDGQLVLSGDATCVGEGTYAWTLQGGILTLEAIDDACAGRDIVVEGSYGPVKTLGDELRKGDLVVLNNLNYAVWMGQTDVSKESSATIIAGLTQKRGLFFSPTILVGSPGQRLEVTVRNPTGGVFVPSNHTFTIDEQGIDVYLEPGQEATVTVTFPDSGSVLFYSRIWLAKGQGGELQATA